MPKRPDDIDNIMESVNRWEKRQGAFANPANTASPKEAERVFVGRVDKFYEKLNVVAIRLSSTLKVGDLIEIGSDDDMIRQRISSIQINRVNVEQAFEGDDIGIALRHKVGAGEEVYKIIK